MAYRNPAFLVRNRAADAGAAAISILVGAAFATGFGKERLIDSRIAKLAKAASAGAWEIGFDLGSSVSLNRLVIPVGHNLSGATVQVYTYTAFGPPAGATQRATVVAGAGTIDLSWSAVSSRYWSVYIPTTTLAWEIGELVLGLYQQTADGIVPGWEAARLSPVAVREFPSREATLIEAAVRRRFVLEHQALGAADLAIYDELLDRGVGRAFWFWPPDDALASPLLMRLEEDGEREQDHPNPKGPAGPQYTVRVAMREQGS